MRVMHEQDQKWPQYCPSHNIALDSSGRCSLCALTNIDPKRVKRAGDHDRLQRDVPDLSNAPPDLNPPNLIREPTRHRNHNRPTKDVRRTSAKVKGAFRRKP